MENQKNSLIMQKVKNILSNNPISVNLAENINISYDDINNIWEYYKQTNEKYIKNYEISDNNLTFIDFLNAKTIYDENTIFTQIFNLFLDQKSDYLLLFYKKGESKFNCLFKTFNKIDSNILIKYNKKINNNISLFWKIELKMNNLKTDFDELYEKLDLNDNAILIVSFY